MTGQPEDRTLAFAQEASLGMPGSIKQIADFLLSEGTGIAQLSMAQIAARTYTSKPTLVRFAKQAGYPGWKDYRYDFLRAIGRQEALRAQQVEVDVNVPFVQGAAPDDLVQSLARIQRLAATDVERTLDRTALHQAASAILSAGRVMCLGAMQNVQRNAIFASNLSLMGVLCHLPGPNGAAPMVRCLTHNDCVVVTSYSGGIKHMPISLVPWLKEQGINIVAVTNSERSPLGELADQHLAYPPREHYHAKVAAFYSGACTSLILDMLFAACYAQRFEKSRSERKALIDDLSGYLSEDFTRMK